MYVFVHMYEGTHGGQKRASEGCESPNMGAKSHTLGLCKSMSSLPDDPSLQILSHISRHQMRE